MLKSFPDVREQDTGAVTGLTALAFDGSDLVSLFGMVDPDVLGQSPFGGPTVSFGMLQRQTPIRVRVVKVVTVDGKKVRKAVLETEKEVVDAGASAEVYRVVPGQAPVAVVTGLTRVTDLAFNPA